MGRGLADRLDGEALHLGLHGVSRDACDAGVDDVPDAGDRQGGLRDVRRQDDTARRLRVGREDAVLLGGRQPREQGHDLEAASGIGLHVTQCVGGVADLALAGQEHQDVARALARQLTDGVHDRLGLVADDGLPLLVLLVGQVDQRPVPDLDRIRPSRDLDDRRRTTLPVREVGGEAIRVDGRGRDDKLEVRTAWQELLEVAEQEVDVEAPLVRLVEDDRVVAAQLPVTLELGEQDAVGHHLDPRVPRGAVGEAHLVADRAAEVGLELGREPLGDRPGRDPAWLGVPDQSSTTAVRPSLAAAELEADLRQLGGLSRPGLPGHDHHLVIPDRCRDVVAPPTDRQLGREGDVHNAGDSSSGGSALRNQIPFR